jgi:hypothetical protein
MADKIQLTDDCINLLKITASELIPKMSANTGLNHVKQQAFDHYDPMTKEVYQVQVTVTRREADFLEPFQTEEMVEYKR